MLQKVKINKFLVFLFYLFFLSCDNNQDEYKTDLIRLSKYISIPLHPENVRYQIIEKPIEWQDCQKEISIRAVLKFSKKDFNKIISLSSIKYNFPLQVSIDSYKSWYPISIKECFQKENSDLKLVPPIYEGDLFVKKDHNINVIFIVTKENEICLLYKFCE